MLGCVSRAHDVTWEWTVRVDGPDCERTCGMRVCETLVSEPCVAGSSEAAHASDCVGPGVAVEYNLDVFINATNIGGVEKHRGVVAGWPSVSRA